MYKLRKILPVLITCLAMPIAYAGGEIHVHDPWVRATPPVAAATAAYMVVENSGSGTLTLIGAQSPYFDKVEVHRTIEEGGIARMVQQKRVEIAPATKLIMKPGDYHVMLIGFKHRAEAGDTVPITLLFEDGTKAELSATVKQSAAGGSHHHHRR